LALSEILNESVANFLGWRRTISQAQYSDLLSNPQVQQAVQRWEAEANSLRNQMRTYLSDLSAST